MLSVHFMSDEQLGRYIYELEETYLFCERNKYVSGRSTVSKYLAQAKKEKYKRKRKHKGEDG